MRPTGSSEPWHLADSLHVLLLWTMVGLVVGVETAILEALWNRYPALGFWRNAIIEGRTLVVAGTAAGAAFGLALLAARFLASRAWHPAARALDTECWNAWLSRPRRGHAWTLLAGAVIGGVVHLLPRAATGAMGLRSAATSGLVICGATLAVMGLVSILSRIARSPEGSSLHRLHSLQWYLLLGVFVIAAQDLAYSRIYERVVHRADSAAVSEYAVMGTGALLIIGLGAWHAGRVRRRPAVGLAPTGVLLLAPALMAASSWSLASSRVLVREPPGRAANVLLIAIDTLRLDHTNLPGSEPISRALTPRLVKLAGGGVTFSNAISQAPWTMPAFASVLTGLYPHEHGAISLTGSLPRRAVTLQEVLRESGYSTGAVVSHYYIAGRVGFDQGFDVMDETNLVGQKGSTSSGVTDRALEFIDAQGGKPFFLMAHYFDPHYEFEDHDAIRFADGYDGWLRDLGDIGALRNMRHMFSVKDLAYLLDLYDEEIVHTDEQIGRLLDGLAARGLAERTAIIVVADHGEEFMERGWLGHTITLHEEVVHVPLVVVLPGLEPVSPVHRSTVETRAIFPTVLEYLGIGHPGSSDSRTLMPAFDPEGDGGEGGAFSVVWLPDAEISTGKRVRMASYRIDGWKLIVDRTRDIEMLFDLRRDPREETNVAGTEAEQGRVMREVLVPWLDRMLASGMAGSTYEPTEEEIEALRSLGYL